MPPSPIALVSSVDIGVGEDKRVGEDDVIGVDGILISLLLPVTMADRIKITQKRRVKT